MSRGKICPSRIPCGHSIICMEVLQQHPQIQSRAAFKLYHKLIQKQRLIILPKNSGTMSPAKKMLNLMNSLIKPTLSADPIDTSSTHCEKLAEYCTGKIEDLYQHFPLDVPASMQDIAALPAVSSLRPALNLFPPLWLPELLTLSRHVKSCSPAGPLNPTCFSNFMTLSSHYA